MLHVIPGTLASLYAAQTDPDAVVTMRLFQLLIILVLPITGIVFACWPQKLAAWLFPADKTDCGEKLTAQSLQPVLFSAIGAFVIVTAIPALAETLSAYIQMREFDALMRQKQMAKMGHPSLIGSLIYFVSGIWLFLGSKGISNLWYNLQKTRPMKQ